MLYCLLVAQDRKCSIDPDKAGGVVGDSHKMTCYSKRGTIILSWKIGIRYMLSAEGTAQQGTLAPGLLPTIADGISTLGVKGTAESVHMISAGYETAFLSLRKSSVKIVKLNMNHASPFYCYVLDIVSKVIVFCQADLNVFGKKLFRNFTNIVYK